MTEDVYKCHTSDNSDTPNSYGILLHCSPKHVFISINMSMINATNQLSLNLPRGFDPGWDVWFFPIGSNLKVVWMIKLESYELFFFDRQCIGNNPQFKWFTKSYQIWNLQCLTFQFRWIPQMNILHVWNGNTVFELFDGV